MGLVVDSINKSFGQLHVIKDLSMEVREGSIFGFLGANGAGKTTTMRMILDIIRPDSGSITWNGLDVREVPRRNWGYLPEERGLYPKVSVEDQLIFLARLHGLSKSSAHKNLDEWLERFQITEYRKKKVEELSKGNQQKIQFLAAIVHDPQILIMDEPFSWLDPLKGVQVTKRRQDYIEMQMQANLNPNVIVEAALRNGGVISRFEVAEPSLTDIFIEAVGKISLPDAPSTLSA